MPVTTQSGANPAPDGKVVLEHAVTVILKQAKDGPLAKALAHTNIEDIVDLLALSPPERDVLVFPLDDGTEKPSRSSPTSAKQMATPLRIGLLSQRRTLIILGPAK